MIRGQRAFFDIRVFDPKTQRHQSKTLRICYKINKQEKREDTVHEFLMFSKELFTKLMFSATGGMGRAYSIFFTKLSQLVSIKRKEKFSVVTYGIRYKISFVLLRSCLLCTRGSQKSNDEYEKQNEKLIYSSRINI